MTNTATETTNKSLATPRPDKISPLLVLIFIFGPYQFLRWGGDNYQEGSSFSAVDGLLFLAGASILISNIKTWFTTSTITLPAASASLLKVGFLFMLLSIISGAEGLFFFDIGDDFSITRLLSGTIQYAFVMIFFPILASQYISLDNLKKVLRFIALGYFTPMIFTIAFLPHAYDERIREIFFYSNRAMGSYGNANTFSGILVMVLPYYVYLAMSEKGFWRLIGYIGVPLSIMCLFLTVSFSGAMMLGCAIAANLLLALTWRKHPANSHKKRFTHLAVSTGVLVVVVSITAISILPSILEDVSRRLFFLDDTSTKSVEIDSLGSGGQRMELIEISLGLLEQRHGGLLFGHGMRQTEAFSEYKFTGNFVVVHLVYLLIWIEGGLPLLLLYVLYLFFMGRNIFFLSKVAPFEAATIGTGILALAFIGMVYPHTYMRFFWIPLLPALIDWRSYLPATINKTYSPERMINPHQNIAHLER